jgi:hypothetical protein
MGIRLDGGAVPMIGTMKHQIKEKYEKENYFRSKQQTVDVLRHNDSGREGCFLVALPRCFISLSDNSIMGKVC